MKNITSLTISKIISLQTFKLYQREIQQFLVLEYYKREELFCNIKDCSPLPGQNGAEYKKPQRVQRDKREI